MSIDAWIVAGIALTQLATTIYGVLVALSEKRLRVALVLGLVGGLGCDYHPSFQQIAMLDLETGEYTRKKLLHGSGEAVAFYRSLQAETRSVTCGRAYLALGKAQLALGRTKDARLSFQSALQNLQETLGADHPLTLNAHAALAETAQPS